MPKVLGKVDLEANKVLWVRKTYWYYVPKFIRNWFK